MADQETLVVGTDGVAPELLAKYELLHKAHTKGNSTDAATKQYDSHGYASTYEELLAEGGCGYNGPCYAAQQLALVAADRTDIRVIDVAAGTGFAGQELHKLGFTNLDALEPSAAMLEVAGRKNVYKHLICDKICQDKLNIEDDTYDAAVIAGGLGEGHIPCVGMTELIRIVKPGGWLVIVTREAYLHLVKEYAERLEPFMMELEKVGKWKCIKRELVEEYSFNEDGIIFVFQILESGYKSFQSTTI